MITTKDETLAWLQSHRSEAKRIIQQWEDAPETESDAPKAARRDLQIIDGLLMRISKNGATEANGRAVEPLSRDEELSYTLGIAAKLEQEKAARLAAEMLADAAIHRVTLLLDLAFDAAQAAQESTSLSDEWHESHSDIRTWVESPQTVDLTAARETMRKAAEWDKVAADYPTDEEADEMHKAFGGPEECTTFGPAALKRNAEQQERRKHDPDFVLPLSEYKALRAEHDELLAMVEAKQRALKLTQEAILEQTNDWPYDLRWKQVCDASNLTPADALAALREEIRQQTLEEAAKYFDDCWSRVAAELRRMAEKEGK
jgi:hypothetical protein